MQRAVHEIEQAGIVLGRRSPRLVINSRPKRRLGMCKLLNPREVRHEMQIFQIELSELTLHLSREILQDTLVHELLHTCKGCFNHGAQWKQYAEWMNAIYGYHISTTAPSGATEGCKPRGGGVEYILECRQCRQKVVRHRMSKVVKHPEYYRCSKCGGTIQRIQ